MIDVLELAASAPLTVLGLRISVSLAEYFADQRPGRVLPDVRLVTRGGTVAYDALLQSREAGGTWGVQGRYDWERSATRWLRELVPARYAGYPALIRHPVLLARHAQIQVQHEIRVARTALQTTRREALARLGLHEAAIEHTIKLYAAEVLQLQHIARSVRAVTEALAEQGAAGR
ncbi:hypothetical protein STENM223S_01236 [Streptomyces tendae]